MHLPTHLPDYLPTLPTYLVKAAALLLISDRRLGLWLRKEIAAKPTLMIKSLPPSLPTDLPIYLFTYLPTNLPLVVATALLLVSDKAARLVVEEGILAEAVDLVAVVVLVAVACPPLLLLGCPLAV